MPARSDQRVIVITGASRGIGLEFVRQLSIDPKHYILALVRHISNSKRLQPFLSENVIAVECDVAKPETFSDIAKKVSEEGDGRVDLLINNAGIMTGAGASWDQGISKSTIAEWDDQWRVNVVGVVFLTNAFLPLLAKSKEKRTINISSMLADRDYHERTNTPRTQFASYSATKAALNMVNLKFHHEFEGQGYIFVALNPGWVKTDLGGGDAAPLTPEDSIQRCLRFINRTTTEHSGQFFTLDGQTVASNT